METAADKWACMTAWQQLATTELENQGTGRCQDFHCGLSSCRPQWGSVKDTQSLTWGGSLLTEKQEADASKNGRSEASQRTPWPPSRRPYVNLLLHAQVPHHGGRALTDELLLSHQPQMSMHSFSEPERQERSLSHTM